MDYYGSSDVQEVGLDLVISVVIGVFSLITIIVFIILIKKLVGS